MLLMVAVAAGLILSAVAGVLVYIVVSARNDTESVTPSTYLLSKFVTLSFKDKSGGEHEGWLLLGLPGAPAVILSHGYNSNRSEVLSMGTLLQQNHFNVFIFNFFGKGTGYTSDLGDRETEQLMAALDTLIKQPGVNPKRVGLWGVSTGAYASLAVAEQSNLVQAIAVDSPYAKPDEMFEALVDRLLGGSSGVFRSVARLEFRLLNLRSKGVDLRRDMDKLRGVPKFFITGRDFLELASFAQELYQRAPEPKKLVYLERSRNALLSGAEKKEYENQVLSFFLQSLPLHAD